LGNLLVSSSVAITFILGGIIVDKPWNRIVFTLSMVVFLFDLGEEIAADVMDMEGDRKRNVKSLAILIGQKMALFISALLFILVILISLQPALWNSFGASYRVIITITDMTILFFVIKLVRHRSIREGRLSIRGIYISATLGLLLFIICKAALYIAK
jgi:geranylgeranylglycerol-phosphate geranylgeranyltransferase